MAGYELMALSRALDRAGHLVDGRRAAAAALSRLNSPLLDDLMRVHALARTGDFEGARALVARATDRPGSDDPDSLRMAIVQGAALAGDLAEVERGLAEASRELRGRMLINALTAVPPGRSLMVDALEERLAAHVAQGSSPRLSMDAMLSFAGTGMQLPLVIASLERRRPGREAAAAAIRIANEARRNGHLQVAATIAQAAERLLPRGPQADAELVDLAEFYWKLGRPERAISTAMRVSHPVGRVDALSRAINPTRGEAQQRLTFATF